MKPEWKESDKCGVQPAQSTVLEGNSLAKAADALSPLATPDVDTRTLFWSAIGPALSSIQRAQGEVEKGEHANLISDLLAVPENRPIVWNFVAEFGTPASMQGQVRQSFVRALLPFVSSEDEQSIRGLAMLAHQAVDSGDRVLYGMIGERSLDLPLGGATLVELARVFARFETHNMEREACLSPWGKLFIERSNGDVCRVFAEALRERVEKNEFSSFDHLVAVLCRSGRAEAALELQKLVDREYRSEPSFIRLSGDSLKAYLGEIFGNLRPSVLARRMLVVFPGALLAESIFQATLSPPLGDVLTNAFGLTAALTAVAISIKARRRIDSLVRKAEDDSLDIAKENAFLDSGAFLHLAEKVYKATLDSRERSPNLRAVGEAIESNSLFADEIEQWRTGQLAAN